MKSIFKQRTRALASMVLPLALVASMACTFGSPPDLPAVHAALYEYVDSGDYDRDLERGMTRARRYLERRAAKVSRPAIILDIDETTLSNWPYQRDYRFAYDAETFHEWVLKAEAEPVPGVLELYRAAREREVAVFFVTGRHEDERAATEHNLRALGIDSWETLDMRPRNDGQPSASVFKTQVRQRITQAGYTIVANVGDQQSDLAGGYALRGFKLPNPFYKVP